MDEGKLRPYDGVAIAGLLTLQGLLYTNPGKMMEQSGSAAWIAGLAAHVLIGCLFLIVTVLMRRYEGRDLITIASMLLGRPVGMLYGIVLALYFGSATGIFVREGAELLGIYALRMTPVYLVAGILLLTAVIMNIFGGRAIHKSAGFFFILVLLGIVFIGLLGMNRYNPDYLFPILGNGAPHIAESGRQMASMIDGVMVLPLLAPAFVSTGAMRKAGVTAIVVSAGATAVFYLCLIMMFSAPIAAKMTSGFMEMGKSIYYNHFFYRFESALLFFLIFSSALLASLGLHFARKCIALTFGPRFPKQVIILCAALALAVAFMPANLMELSNQYLAIFRRYGVFLTAGFPLLLFLISSVKRGFKHEKG